jgi:hypothetical protein
MNNTLYEELMSLFLRPISMTLEIESDEKLHVGHLGISGIKLEHLYTNILLKTEGLEREELILSLLSCDNHNKIYFSIFEPEIEMAFLETIYKKRRLISEKLPNTEICARYGFHCLISKNIIFGDDYLFILDKPGLKKPFVMEGNYFDKIPDEQTSNFGVSPNDHGTNVYKAFYVDTIIDPKNALNISIEKPQLKFLFSLNYKVLKQYCKPAWKGLTK